MTFKTLGERDFPDDQVLGLEIAFKNDANAGYTRAQSPEEYLLEFLVRKMQDFAAQHVSGEVFKRIVEAEQKGFERNEPSDVLKINQTAAIWEVSTVVDVPPDEAKKG